MDALAIYSITTAGVFITILIARILMSPSNFVELFAVLLSRHLTLPLVFH